MSRIYDNWERLVDAVLKKEQLWKLFHASPSISSDSSEFSSRLSLSGPVSDQNRDDNRGVETSAPNPSSFISAAPQPSPKKRNFQVEAFKHKVVKNPKYAVKTWKILEQAIHEIYNHNTTSVSIEELYRNAYNMVLYKFGELLYSGLVSTMSFHLQTMSKSIEAAQGPLFLDELNTKWNDHNKALHMICDVLWYTDRAFIPSTHKTPIHELGLIIWRDIVIHSSKIQPLLLNTVLELILRERSGEVINRGLMKNIIKMFMDLGSSVYQEEFEKPFLEASTDFYRAESQDYIERSDCGEYLKKTEWRLNEEIERVSHYLDTSSESKISNIVEKEMIDNHMVRLVHMENSGLVEMLHHDKIEDLGRMYSLFRRVPNGLVTVRDVMTSHIREMGKQAVTENEKSESPVEFADILLEKRDKYDRIVNLAFANDQTFQNAVSSSFEYCISLNGRSPEYVSLFADDKLQKGKEEDIVVGTVGD